MNWVRVGEPIGIVVVSGRVSGLQMQRGERVGKAVNELGNNANINRSLTSLKWQLSAITTAFQPSNQRKSSHRYVDVVD